MVRFFSTMMIIILFSSCTNDKYVTEYYPNGEIKTKTQTDINNIPNGFYKEYYETGELKILGNYVNGLAKDTMYEYYKNGDLKSKGLLDENLKIKKGWWFYYNSLGDVKNKEQHLIIRDSTYKNQSVYYNNDGYIDKNKSSFYQIDLPDTISLGKNLGNLYYYSNFNNVKDKIFNVIIENEYSDSEIRLDTFGDKKEETWFGVFAHKKGDKIIKGQIVETLFYEKQIDIDSFELTVREHKKYFEREVYVKDTIE